jgi:hypothetical protein
MAVDPAALVKVCVTWAKAGRQNRLKRATRKVEPKKV